MVTGISLRFKITTTANTKIYWKNGLSASITQGDQKKDIITFVNINNKIFGSAVNNFE